VRFPRRNYRAIATAIIRTTGASCLRLCNELHYCSYSLGATGALVFEDPSHLSRVERVVQGEERWQTIGNAGGIVLLLVVHTWPEETAGEQQIRIISARRATREERELYEEGV